MTFSGGDVVAGRLESIAANASRVLERAVKEVANEIIETAVERTPELTGALKSTGRATIVTEGDSIESEFRFGGQTNSGEAFRAGSGAPGFVNYAVAVHERTEVFHDEGQAKFLESTLNEAAPHWTKSVAAHAKRLLDG